MVLAAGGSTRLGQPKQLLRRDGETLVSRACRLADATAPRRVLVVLGAGAEANDAALDGVGAERLDNHQWRDGLSSSLKRAVVALRPGDQRLLILGCDQPALESPHLLRLLDAARVAPGRCAATAYGEDFGMPAVVPVELLQQAVLKGDSGLRGAFAQLGAEQVTIVPAPELALDLDTPADLAQARALGLIDPLQ